ncbi:unnamed protein product [Paramecium octaurelia]|uniref:Uncharacterized protein n=1 Tax=Paramecium octaurelia TaxID=43137 RepID=A0A8S1X658_PAROT|nr:unnamed protein product [Paramecium octaurelia]
MNLYVYIQFERAEGTITTKPSSKSLLLLTQSQGWVAMSKYGSWCYQHLRPMMIQTQIMIFGDSVGKLQHEGQKYLRRSHKYTKICFEIMLINLQTEHMRSMMFQLCRLSIRVHNLLDYEDIKETTARMQCCCLIIHLQRYKIFYQTILVIIIMKYFRQTATLCKRKYQRICNTEQATQQLDLVLMTKHTNSDRKLLTTTSSLKQQMFKLGVTTFCVDTISFVSCKIYFQMIYPLTQLIIVPFNLRRTKQAQQVQVEQSK